MLLVLCTGGFTLSLLPHPMKRNERKTTVDMKTTELDGFACAPGRRDSRPTSGPISLDDSGAVATGRLSRRR
jgi:hypothetical protein